MKRERGDVLIVPHDCTEMLFRGELTAAECAAAVTGWDEDREAVGEPWVTWAHTGFVVDEDGDVHTGGVYYGDRYAGKRGAFRVTEIDTRERPVVDPYDAKRAAESAPVTCARCADSTPGIVDACPYAAEIGGKHDDCPDNCCEYHRRQCCADI